MNLTLTVSVTNASPFDKKALDTLGRLIGLTMDLERQSMAVVEPGTDAEGRTTFLGTRTVTITIQKED